MFGNFITGLFFPLLLEPLKNNGGDKIFLILIFITCSIFMNKQIIETKTKLQYFLFGTRVDRSKVTIKSLEFYLIIPPIDPNER